MKRGFADLTGPRLNRPVRNTRHFALTTLSFGESNRVPTGTQGPELGRSFDSLGARETETHGASQGIGTGCERWRMHQLRSLSTR